MLMRFKMFLVYSNLLDEFFPSLLNNPEKTFQIGIYLLGPADSAVVETLSQINIVFLCGRRCRSIDGGNNWNGRDAAARAQCSTNKEVQKGWASRWDTPLEIYGEKFQLSQKKEVFCEEKYNYGTGNEFQELIWMTWKVWLNSNKVVISESLGLASVF